jgi:hypothetical protein
MYGNLAANSGVLLSGHQASIIGNDVAFGKRCAIGLSLTQVLDIIVNLKFSYSTKY